MPSVYEIVTSQIVELLETGVVPWRRPWASTGTPRNLVSQKPYRGINYFLLSASKYVSPFWLTYRQASQLGGYVRKGEESTVVVFWKIEDRRGNADDHEADEQPDTEAQRRRWLLRYYRVFNLEQVELPESVRVRLPKVEIHEHDPIDSAARIIEQMPCRPEIVRQGSQAYYSPITDRVTLPPRELFISPEQEAATAFHELSHSTGHKKRLAREGIMEIAPFGSPLYSREELVAELSAGYLCAEAQVANATIANQAAYIAGWLKALRGDSRLIVQAAAQAQHAADYILSRDIRARAMPETQAA